MHKGKYVFAQLLDFIDKDVFLRPANKYDGNRYVKQFTCWNQLVALSSVSFPTVKVFVMLSWQLWLMHPKHITLDLVGTLPRVLLQMTTPSAIIASSRSLPIKSLPKLNDAESLSSSS